MKEMLTRNLNLKILSLLIAFIVWLIIINIEDPAIVGNFEGIPVTIINESALDEIDKVYDVVSGSVVDMEVKGKRSVIENLSRSDFVATANLEELSIVNAMEIKVSVPKYGNQVEIIDQSVSTMEISIEDLVTEQFRVDIVEIGTVKEGYYVDEKTASPNIVQVKGAESVISKIKEVVVEVNVSGADETFTVTEEQQVYDYNGTLIEPSKMEMNYNEFNITVNLLETKTVKLFIELKGTPLAGYDYVGFEYEPKEVEIAGSKEMLGKVPHIKGEFNISGLYEDIEDEINITEFIKEDVILISENQNVAIHVDFEKLEKKDITFPVSSIEVINLPEGKRVEFLDKELLIVGVTGLSSKTQRINRSNINPYIDLSNIVENRGYIPIKFENDIEDIEFSYVSALIEIHDVEE